MGARYELVRRKSLRGFGLTPDQCPKIGDKHTVLFWIFMESWKIEMDAVARFAVAEA